MTIKSKIFNAEQVQFILDNYKGITWKEMCKRFNKRFGTSFTYDTFKGFGSRHKLNNGVNTCFKKGQVPHNKGKKMSDKQYTQCERTMFKKGSIPPNRREIGDERFDKDGYVCVKVADGKRNRNWKPKHHVVYESVHGPIPPGYRVCFLDGDKYNFDVNNIVIVKKGVHATVCKSGGYTKNADITQANILIKSLDYEAKRKKKK